MPKIVETRSGVIDGSAQADLTRESIKGSAHIGAFQATAMIVEQKAGGALSWHQPVATLCVFGQDIASRNMERNQTTLVELSLADGKQSLIKIHVLAIQFDGLADA